VKNVFELSQDTRDALQAATDAVLEDVFGHAVRAATSACFVASSEVEKEEPRLEPGRIVNFPGDDAPWCESIFGGTRCEFPAGHTGAHRAGARWWTENAVLREQILALKGKLSQVRHVLERHHVIDGGTAIKIHRELVGLVIGWAEEVI
jgi:hypothetical protein